MAMAWTPVIGSSGLWPGAVVPKPSAMALTIALGAAAAAAVFGELTIEEALILAVVLAPTDDGALGKALVTEPRVPQRIRQDLNAENGLNDGICVPLLFAAVAIADVEPEISRAAAAPPRCCCRRSATAFWVSDSLA